MIRLTTHLIILATIICIPQENVPKANRPETKQDSETIVNEKDTDADEKKSKVPEGANDLYGARDRTNNALCRCGMADSQRT